MSMISIIEKLNIIEQYIKNGTQSDKWLSLKEVSVFTSTSPSTIYRAVSSGKLKGSKVTGKLLFKTSWINKWLEGGDEL